MLQYSDFDYELIDCGNFRRIERFGKYILNRPCPEAFWNLKIPENKIPVDFYYRREKNKKLWEIQNKNFEKLPENWEIQVGKIKAQMKLAPNNQVGIFPEQFDNWQFIENLIKNPNTSQILNPSQSPLDRGEGRGEKIKNPSQPSFDKEGARGIKIMNTFAYSGMASLFASSENTEVCHVDGAKSANNRFRENIKISGLGENKIRWITDDVVGFLEKEIKRENFYDGIILDPPAFGRGAKSEWHIQKDLPKLMKLVQQVLTPNPLFVILTCHAPEHFSPQDLAKFLENLPQFKGKKAEILELKIPSKKGNSLVSSFGARIR